MCVCVCVCVCIYISLYILYMYILKIFLCLYFSDLEVSVDSRIISLLSSTNKTFKGILVFVMYFESSAFLLGSVLGFPLSAYKVHLFLHAVYFIHYSS
jgi:hypothetical protein